MGLPPKIELALGYLGGTEATRIREYIEDLEQQFRTAESIAKQALRELAKTEREAARLQGFLIEDWKP